MSRVMLLPASVGGAPTQPLAGQIPLATGAANKFKPAFQGRYAASAIPFIMAPTGTMANNGAITLGTALGSATAFGNCYLYLPASAISAGSAAGWYFAQMSSATVGTVFNNVYSSGIPTIPASPVAFATTGPGAYTGVTGAQVAVSLTIPGGTMGPNGRLRISAIFTNNNTAGTKNSIAQIGPGPATIFNAQQTTNVSISHSHEFCNRGAQNVNVAQPTALIGPGSTGGAIVYQTVDTSVAVTFSFAMNDNTATDWQVLESWMIEVFQATPNG